MSAVVNRRTPRIPFISWQWCFLHLCPGLVDVNVCSIMVCASLDYFLTLANFFVEGAPTPRASANPKPIPTHAQRASVATRRRSKSLHVSTNPSSSSSPAGYPEEADRATIHAVVFPSLQAPSAVLLKRTVLADRRFREPPRLPQLDTPWSW